MTRLPLVFALIALLACSCAEETSHDGYYATYCPDDDVDAGQGRNHGDLDFQGCEEPVGVVHAALTTPACDPDLRLKTLLYAHFPSEQFDIWGNVWSYTFRNKATQKTYNFFVDFRSAQKVEFHETWYPILEHAGYPVGGEAQCDCRLPAICNNMGGMLFP